MLTSLESPPLLPVSVSKRSASPFVSGEQAELQATTFRELFEMSVAATSEAEEGWAFERMRELHAEAIASSTRPNPPSLFDALSWAARQPPLAPA